MFLIRMLFDGTDAAFDVAKSNADFGLRPADLEKEDGAEAGARAGKTNGGLGTGPDELDMSLA